MNTQLEGFEWFHMLLGQQSGVHECGVTQRSAPADFGDFTPIHGPIMALGVLLWHSRHLIAYCLISQTKLAFF